MRTPHSSIAAAVLVTIAAANAARAQERAPQTNAQPSDSSTQQSASRRSTPLPEAELTQVTGVAREALTAENQALVRSAQQSKQTTLQTAKIPYRSAIQSRLELHQSIREALAKEGLIYSSAHTDVQVDHIEVQGSRLRMEVTEYASFTLQAHGGDPSAPTETKRSENHVLTFVKTDGLWRLTQDAVRPSFVSALPSYLDFSEDGTATSRTQPALKMGTFADPVRFGTANAPIHLAGFETPVSVRYRGQLDRNAMVTYCQTYIPYDNNHKRNTKFPYLPDNNCTNLVSQALDASGWTMAWGDYRSVSAWYYASSGLAHLINNGMSYSWGGANPWGNYAFASGRATIVRARDVRVGDIVQADWTADGIYDHTMIITRIDSQGVLYLSYDSKPNLNVSWTEFIKRAKGEGYSNPVFLYWHLKDSL